MSSAALTLTPNWVVVRVATLGRLGLFLAAVALHVARPWRQWRVTLNQLHFIGARSMTVTAVAGGFVGMVVALQFYDTLVRFGSGQFARAPPSGSV